MQAFIVRPFGVKQDIDFDRVESELIQPALKAAGIAGKTTGEIMEAGNIRADMFSELLTADLVIADISIHNANVFYELGVRHALRDKRTYLIRCSRDEVPFDIKTDRYLSYDAANPGACREALIRGLQATILSDRQDSPVFYMLPKLEAQDAERFLAVPQDFGEEVEIAKACRQGGKLALLAAEAENFPWQIPALRMVGEVQYQIKDMDDARITWEKVRDRYPDDPEANDRLTNIYQRLAEEELKANPPVGWELLAQSDIAVKRLLKNYAKFNKNKRAEIYALKARNAKARWVSSWRDAPEDEVPAKALLSSHLKEAYKEYERGYNEDLNHYYSGINALGLLTVIISLAESYPDVWEYDFETKEEAVAELIRYRNRQQKLATVIKVAIEANKRRMDREERPTDPWLSMTEADLACLTATRPQRVGYLYEKVIEEANDLNFDAAKKQLLIYEKLGVVPGNVKAALEAFSMAKQFNTPAKGHYLLFTGHMVDKADRKEPRFPPGKEEDVRAAIKEKVLEEQKKAGTLTGIAGGACGGDILFHEVCEELGIPTELYLALPREQFIVESVDFAGPQWVERFDRLINRLPEKVLCQTKKLPNWLQKNPDYTIWERNNLWMLYSALECGGINTTLLALWDGKGGDGPGGTQHMVQETKKRGAKTVVIKMEEVGGKFEAGSRKPGE